MILNHTPLHMFLYSFWKMYLQTALNKNVIVAIYVHAELIFINCMIEVMKFYWSVPSNTYGNFII